MKKLYTLSQCPYCLCMTHTIKKYCGKCGARKVQEKKDIHFNPGDDSTTVTDRATTCCGGHHQTIAGALIRSKEWGEWYEYAQDNMLFDVSETQETDSMSDKHLEAFIQFTKHHETKED